MVKNVGRTLLFAIVWALTALGCGSVQTKAEPSAPSTRLNVFHPAGVREIGSLDLLEKSLGFRFQGATWYQDWDQPVDLAVARRFQDHMLISTCVWQPIKEGQGITCQAIANGDYDPYIKQNAIALRDSEIKIRLEPFAEMNGDWSRWYPMKQGNEPVHLRNAWQRIVKTFRDEGAKNVHFVWTFNIRYGGDRFSYRDLYPGDEWVDFVGLDGYNWGTGGPHIWTEFRDVFGRSYAELVTMTIRPIIITETACAEHESGNKGEWITRMFRDLPVLFPRIKEITWFNEKKERDWHIDSSPGSFEAFQRRGRLP